MDSLETELQLAEESKDKGVIDAAQLKLNQHHKICQEMETISKNYKIHYERSLFHIAATLAHECFHVLTGLWTGFVKEITPPDFFGSSKNEKEGEAGEWWAYNHGFDGAVHLVWHQSGKKKDDPNPLDDDDLSAGIPFVKQIRYGDDGLKNGEEWTQISHDYIKDIIKKGMFGYILGVYRGTD